ncbi:MAG: hypothetical protein WBP79_00295 [Candidatus Acidiferrales bacterium]
MARGWESKAVEEQVKEFQGKEKGNPRMPLTPAQAEVHRRREVLLLSRARVQKDLESSQDPRYREQLQHALADLDARLSELPDVL